MEDGYVFPSDGVVAITYNGQPLEMIADDKSYSDYHPNGSYTVDERQFALGYVYAKAVDSATQTVVKNLDLTVGQPVAGQPAPQASTAFEGVGSVETLWSLVDPNGRYIIAEEFEAGKTYVCRITVTLNDGYLFPENGELDAVTINGKKIPFNPSDEAEAGGYWAGTEVVGDQTVLIAEYYFVAAEEQPTPEPEPNKDAPATGDPADLLLWYGLLASAAAGYGLIASRKKH